MLRKINLGGVQYGWVPNVHGGKFSLGKGDLCLIVPIHNELFFMLGTSTSGKMQHTFIGVIMGIPAAQYRGGYRMAFQSSSRSTSAVLL